MRGKTYLLNLFFFNDLQKINSNTKVIARMLLILLGNIINISHGGGVDLGFRKHFSPICRSS